MHMKQNKNLLIVGTGQYGCVAKETAQAMRKFEKIDFVDDNSPLAIAATDALGKLRCEYEFAFVAIGCPDVRLAFIRTLEQLGYQVATLIHPMAYVAPSACVEKGCSVEPCAVVQANAHIGEGCLISSGAVVNHNAAVERGCHIDCNATVTARSVVKQKTKVECGQVYQSALPASVCTQE